MNKCAICDSPDVLDLEFGIDIAPFKMCEECYNRFIDPICKGVTAVFPYIGALNPEKTARQTDDPSEFQCEICLNVEDYTNLHILWLNGYYCSTCDFCADKMITVIRMTVQALRGVRDGEVS